MRGKVGIATDTVPLVWEEAVDASEISALTIAIVASAVSAGVNVGNPATVAIEHSFDDGATWIALTNLNGAVVTAAGTFLTSVSLSTGLVAPIIRVTLTAPAGQSVTVTKARKNRFLPGTLISFAGSSFLGGTSVDANLVMQYGPGGVFVDTEVAYDTTTPANTRPLPVRLVNDTGVMDFGVGAAGAQTPRVYDTAAAAGFVQNAADLAVIQGQLTTIDGHVDGVEGALATLNAKDFATQVTLDALKTSVEARLGGSLVPGAYDYIGTDTSGALTDVHTYKLGGAGGAVVKTVTVTYSAVDKLTVTSTASV